MLTPEFEYLFFNAAIATSVLLSTLVVESPFRQRWVRAWISCLVVSIPYIFWDSLVVDRHWWFNPSYISPWKFFGLPLGEWLFFFTVPLACLMSWEIMWRPLHRSPPLGRWVYWPPSILIVASAFAWHFGYEYTALACVSVPISAMLDYLWGSKLYRQRRFYGHLFVVCIWVTIFDGYLAGRPIVLYDSKYFLGLRLGSVPIEDYAYAIGWLGCVHSLYMKLTVRPLSATQAHALGQLRHRIFSSPIRWRLHNYRETLSAPQASRLITELSGINPSTLTIQSGSRAKVAVIGGGLAGMRAALTLAESGLDVELFEQASYFGGKVGSWKIPGPNGESQTIEHGFHAFFRHYYNLNEFLQKCGATSHLRPISDYLIVTADGRRFSYQDIQTTPIYNLISLLTHGHFRLRDLLSRPSLWRLLALLQYDPKKTSERYDRTSYAEFAEQVQLPDDLRLTFNSFSRAFFAPPEQMSTAELLKSFHFFFLSNDAGLLYDYLATDYHEGLIVPIVSCLRKHGVRMRLESKVSRISSASGRFSLCTSDGQQEFDAVVLASDVPGTRTLLSEFDTSDSEPKFVNDQSALWHKQASNLKVSSSYAVWRVWFNQPIFREDLCPFFITERRDILDSITIYERIHSEARHWADKNQGCILELHCYCVPEEMENESKLRHSFIQDLEHFIPELKDATILCEHLQWRRDFPAFHVGQYATRPTTRTPIPGLVLAGDWVKLPVPAMLMEAACTSGQLAANEILLALGHKGVPITTVPRHGMLA